MPQEEHSMKLEERLTGTTDPTLSGGFLHIKSNGRVIGTITVPAFDLDADNYYESLKENEDEFDDSGITYSIEVRSSNKGVDWTLKIDPSENEDLINSIEYQFDEDY